MTQELTKLPYALLRPVKREKLSRNDIAILTGVNSTEQLEYYLKDFGKGELLAVDIETRGTQAANPNDIIVGIGVSNGRKALYLDLRSSANSVRDYLFDYLGSPDKELIGHNVFFDAAFLTRDSGRWFNWKYDTYGLYRQLATEGWPGQKWSLKTAQIELLNWSSTNEKDLDHWLIDNLEPSDIKKEYKPGYYPRDTEHGLRYLKPDKSQMYQAPAEILGYYCCLDASSTFDLYQEVMIPSLNKLVPAARRTFRSYHTGPFINSIRKHIEQQLRGILVNRPRLEEHSTSLEQGIEQVTEEFYNHPDIKAAIELVNKRAIAELKAKEPDKYKKIPTLGKAPNQFKKDGSVSKNWLKWKEKEEKVQELLKNPPLSKNWKNWYGRLLEAENTNHFNLNSAIQKRWLFYEHLGYPVILKAPSGAPSVDKRALLGWGEPGQLLKRNNDLTKEHGYVMGCLNNLSPADTIHPRFRIPGTLTGRTAGSDGVNFHQVPKSREYLSCYIPRPGNVFVDCDHTALEQVVLAELSKDPTLFKLYGPEAKKNDVYLFNGSNLPGLSTSILSHGYNPDNPTSEAIAITKKLAKRERGISKTITLGSVYGMGADNLSLSLRLEGIDCTEEKAAELLTAYWDLYKGVKEYKRALLDEYRRRGGWVYNGIGRPIGIYNELLKDVVNRVIQSTGHDLHILWSDIFDELCQERGLEVYPVIWDWHDQTIVECPESEADKVAVAFMDSYDILNERLSPVIPLSGGPQIVRNLAEAKIED